MTTSANAMRVSPENATADSELLGAYAAIATGIKRPAPILNRLKDAARGRPIAALGNFPRDAEIVARAGGSWFYLSRPLYVQLARLRSLCNGTLSITLRDALTIARKEQSEADVSELNIALSCANPDLSQLATADRELREAIQAEETLAEVIENRLYGEKK